MTKPMDNHMTICGNMTGKPELRYTSDGTPVANFSIAINRTWESNGEKKTEATFWPCTAWRGLAEHIAESLETGQRVLITGRSRQRTWQADDGTNRSRMEIEVDDIGHSLLWGTSVFTKEDRQAKAKEETTPVAEARQGGGDEPPPPNEPF